MTESQKLFASLSGAVIAHLLFFIVVFLFLGMESVSSSSTGMPEPRSDAPREVTVMLDELIDFAKIEPEPEPIVEPGPKPFIGTELNRAEENAPENPRFESDRNTSAATELMPNLDLPQTYGPTLAGEEAITSLQLQNREFVEETAATDTANPAAVQSSSGAFSDSLETGEDDETVDGQQKSPLQEVAKEVRRPEMSDQAGDDIEESRVRSFVDPNGGDYAIGAPTEKNDEELTPETSQEEGEIGNRTDEAMEKTAKSSEGVGSESGDSTGDSPQESMEGMNGDEGLFSADFTPEERQNIANGTLTNIGQNAVDAEDTPMGRYKQTVRTAIAKKWHRYRQDNADFVSWGFLKLHFRVDRVGNVNGLEILENKANAVLAEFSVKAIMDADLPPMPEDVAKQVGDRGMKMDYDIIIY